MASRWVCGATVAVSTALPLTAQEENLLRNGAFADVRPAQAPLSADQGFGVWILDGGDGVPEHWVLNSALPGAAAVLTGEAVPPENRCLRLRARAGGREAHIWQTCPSLRQDACYRVRARLRGGPGRVGVYEYFAEGPMRTPGILELPAATEDWQTLEVLYRPPAGAFRNAAVYLAATPGHALEVAEVRLSLVPGVAFAAEPIVLETNSLRLVLSDRGAVTEFTDRATGKDYADTAAGRPICSVRRDGRTYPAIGLAREGGLLRVWFARPDVTAGLRVVSRPGYLVLSVGETMSPGADALCFCDLSLRMDDSLGTLLNLAQEDAFAACLLAANERTQAVSSAIPQGARLQATAFAEYGFSGAAAALIGAPRERVPAVIEQVELDLGLPHPTRDGLWLRNHPGRFASYLMAYGTNETNVDAVIEFARNGFGCIELLNWWESTPTYAPSRRDFPGGMAGLKACAARIHAAGLQVGLHAMQGMVGWGGVGMKDPYVSPVADPRLLQDRQTTLALDADDRSTELTAAEDLAAWPEQGDLFLDGELVRYGERSGNRFLACVRGLHGTRVSPHPAGTRVGRLVNCFPNWGHCIYAPSADSTMIDEICDNLARVFDATEADMAYFDGGEELACQPPHWRNQGRIALGVMRRVRKPFFLGGNALYTNLSWHVITRGSPNYDPIYYGRDEFTLRFKGPNPAGHARNLLVGDVGWFAPHTHSLSTHAVTPDEVMLLCLKALAGNAPISFIVSADNLYANRRIPEMLEIIRVCDLLKQAGAFSDDVRGQLAEPGRRHWLETDAAGVWQVRPLSMSPRRMLHAGAPEGVPVQNPCAEQTPWLRLRAATRIAEFGAPGNVPLADPDKGIPFTPDGTAASELSQTLEMAPERTPAGGAAVRYRAVNAGKAPSAWCRVTRAFPAPLDLSRHRALALWVHARNSGGILNVQLMNPYNGAREHYVPLDFTGWRLVTLEIAEEARFYEYQWPYHFPDVMYRPFDYRGVTGLRLYLNAIPPGVEAECLVGRIEALAESAEPLADPVLICNEQSLRFPAVLRPDEYLELDWQGVCRQFEPDGALIRQFHPEGGLRCPSGAGTIRLECRQGPGFSPRAELVVATRGDPIPNTPPAGVALPPAPSETGELALLPGGKRGLRLMFGRYELAGEQPPAELSALDATPRTWLVRHTAPTPSPAGVAILNTSPAQSADPDAPGSLLLEGFTDLAPYAMGPGNDSERFAIGAGKQLTDQGPVREGVSHSLRAGREGPRPGVPAAEYAARNTGPAEGWCAVGRRFPAPLDLRPTPVLSLWVHGDGLGETLRFQLRDATGKHADWLTPITFRGWQRLAFPAEERPDFDWSRTAYVLFYFNGIPAGAACALGLAELKALPPGGTPACLTNAVLTLNDTAVSLPVSLAPGEGLTLDPAGRLRVWAGASAPVREVTVPGAALALAPGDNTVTLQPGPETRPPDRLSVRVVPLPAAP